MLYPQFSERFRFFRVFCGSWVEFKLASGQRAVGGRSALKSAPDNVGKSDPALLSGEYNAPARETAQLANVQLRPFQRAAVNTGNQIAAV